MNRENIRRVIELITNAPEERTNMHNYAKVTSCGTAYCIAGWALYDKLGEAAGPDNCEHWVGICGGQALFEAAAERLGLDFVKAHDLFLLFHKYDDDGNSVGEPTKAVAISVLLHMLDTGKVDWRRAYENPWTQNVTLNKELPKSLTDALAQLEAETCLINS